jgi:hypothetical protein
VRNRSAHGGLAAGLPHAWWTLTDHAVQHRWHAFRWQYRIEIAWFIAYNLSNRTGFASAGFAGSKDAPAHAPPLRKLPQIMTEMHAF